VEDARLVALNARDAADRGAEVLVRSPLMAARRVDGLWEAEIANENGAIRQVRARALVNAAGPWVAEVLRIAGPASGGHAPKLVQGSHIVVPRLYEGAQAFTFQSADGRVVFAIPYEHDFTLIGTTDVPYDGDAADVAISPDEIDYLCGVASEYFERPVAAADVVWSYSGVRPLYDDGSISASAVTRDYVFDLDAPEGEAPLLSIYGGKLTTYRKLAPLLAFDAKPWTGDAPLPGGDIDAADFDAFVEERTRRYAWLPADVVRRLARAYGTVVDTLLAGGPEALGEDFGGGLYEAELRRLRDHEWARTAEDVLWRRSKLGLHLPQESQRRIAAWFDRA
jgi:glycerol-3-phosphate dehydrogenase